jgi:anti-sigma regulatory factor (Ser/Thr protein kinase)
VSDEVADDLVLARNEVATNAVLYGSGGGQPIQVIVHVNDDWVEASVLDHGPQPPAGLPADPDVLHAGGRACGCCSGWWTRYPLSAFGSGPA